MKRGDSGRRPLGESKRPEPVATSSQWQTRKLHSAGCRTVPRPLSPVPVSPYKSSSRRPPHYHNMHSSSLALLAVLLGLAAAGGLSGLDLPSANTLEYAPALYKYSDSHYSPFFPSHGASYRSPHYGGGHDGSYAPSYGGYGAPHFGQAHYAPSYGGYGYGRTIPTTDTF